MGISRQSVEEFRETYRKEYGEDISEAEARDMFARLVILYEMLLAHYLTFQTMKSNKLIIRGEIKVTDAMAK